MPDGVKTHIAINRLQQFIAENRSPDSEQPLTFHGLRHSYAQERYLRFFAEGRSEREACLRVSRLPGHERPEITGIYLAGLNSTTESGENINNKEGADGDKC